MGASVVALLGWGEIERGGEWQIGGERFGRLEILLLHS